MHPEGKHRQQKIASLSPKTSKINFPHTTHETKCDKKTGLQVVRSGQSVVMAVVVEPPSIQLDDVASVVDVRTIAAWVETDGAPRLSLWCAAAARAR